MIDLDARLNEIEERHTKTADMGGVDINYLLRLSRALATAGESLRRCSAVRDTGSCRQCEGLMESALAAYRLAQGGG